jgi:hypothetical protein
VKRLECHAEAFFALTHRASSFFSTASDEKYTPVLFAGSFEASPWAMKAACCRRY